MAATLNPWPTTRQGAKDHSVTTLQFLLLAHGQTVTVDGVFGAQTGDAVRAFQWTKNLPDNGIVCPDTWAALVVEVGPGARGNAVRGLQREFRTEVDGEFGPATEQAVRAFQESAAIPADGVAGRTTWQALVGGVRSASMRQAA
ncbi:peptidoglycan-binding protein [Actinoplanes sp. DH11]|uniref:peptidoglycan-binding domain-containing protein n=1 Tax=Actinoplanes sp. DH11 TaxID=2857011 RepID=UPI001E5F14B3|nr:peptidoglycan-binding protein [Actinoplanes sp. DH11]